MEINEFIKLISKKWGSVFSLVFVITVATIGLSLINPLKYEAKSRLLVIQSTSGNDLYALSRSNEYLGNLFSQIAYSGSFYNLVLDSSYNIDKSYFSGSYSEQIKKWHKTVNTKTLADTGIININVYHPNPYQAQQIALAVNDVMMNKNNYYQGGEQGIKVNIIDQPLVSNYPVKPNIPQNAGLALISGFVFALGYIYLFPEERYNIRLWPKRKIKNTSHKIKINYYPLPAENVVLEENNDSEFQPQGDMANVLR